MCSKRVLVLLVFLTIALVRLVHSFSWDIVVGDEKQLKFYLKGTLTQTKVIPSAYLITSVTYDPVHCRVLFADTYSNVSISSFDLSTRKIQRLLTRQSDGYHTSVDYDPVTQLLFWKDDRKIYSLSLKPALTNETVDGNLLVTLKHHCRDIAVDSCGGYIYWITDYEIERARFNGSDREILIQSKVYERRSIAIDQQTQKMYWFETIEYDEYNNKHYSDIVCADFNGKNRRRLYTVNQINSNSLAVSKDFIYWREKRPYYRKGSIWQLPKNGGRFEKAKLFPITDRDGQYNCSYCQIIAANYSIKEQTQGIRKCDGLKSLKKNNSEPGCTDVIQLCVHGTEVSGELRCECAQGYTGERCDVSLCHNYCLQGDCSVSAEGRPQCRCKADYSGERCEVSACYKYCLNNGVCSFNEKDEPVCQCAAAYEGVRCDVSICKDYCLQGNCSVDTVGRPKCR